MIEAILFVILTSPTGVQTKAEPKHYPNILRCAADAKATVKVMASAGWKAQVRCEPVVKS